MKILTKYAEGKLTVFLQGELDHHAAKATMSEIESWIDEYLPRECVMDMSGVKFMDSSGIAVILRVHKHMNGMGGRAWIENIPEQVYRVINASGIDRMVSIGEMK